jgi:hypothetical protein
MVTGAYLAELTRTHFQKMNPQVRATKNNNIECHSAVDFFKGYQSQNKGLYLIISHFFHQAIFHLCVKTAQWIFIMDPPLQSMLTVRGSIDEYRVPDYNKHIVTVRNWIT